MFIRFDNFLPRPPKRTGITCAIIESVWMITKIYDSCQILWCGISLLSGGKCNMSCIFKHKKSFLKNYYWWNIFELRNILVMFCFLSRFIFLFIFSSNIHLKCILINFHSILYLKFNCFFTVYYVGMCLQIMICNDPHSWPINIPLTEWLLIRQYLIFINIRNIF